MKICFSIKTKGIGGPSIFVDKFSKFLKRKNIEVTFEINDDFDIFLVIAQYSISAIKKIKKRGIKIIQRLDGIYSPACSPHYEKRNEIMKEIHNDLADFVIYQSEFCKKSAELFLGKAESSTIIYNGVDLNLFRPRRVKKTSSLNVLLSFGKIRRESQIVPIVRALPFILKKEPQTMLLVAGSVAAHLQRYLKKKGIKYLGVIPNSNLPEIIKMADLFPFSTFKPACPNVVIEALASGLPVVGYKTGCMSELVGDAGILVPSKYDGWDYFPCEDPKPLAEGVLEVLKNRRLYSRRARERAEERFSLELMGRKYLNVFERVLSGI
jgi:glycosyltransferase involved in cell wall biosynthesis